MLKIPKIESSEPAREWTRVKRQALQLAFDNFRREAFADRTSARPPPLGADLADEQHHVSVHIPAFHSGVFYNGARYNGAVTSVTSAGASTRQLK